MLKIFITPFLLCTILFLSCSKNRLYKDAVIIYKSDCTEYVIQLTEGLDYLDVRYLCSNYIYIFKMIKSLLRRNLQGGFTS